ncbi:hypothetical protein GCM10009850_118940 [Nonomuraea monospora]|uniref:MBL fold metallo-hydrolase n=1 Tax=Nonomuraea monospora TaxID=568818 RepID=A0ABP5PZ77_9ACTN
MISIEALPAADGDCLWVEWAHRGRTRRMIVDGGRGSVLLERLHRLPEDDRHIDLIVCTHIDVDHIDGLVALFGQPPPGLSVGQVWFNGRRHLRQDIAGPRQGDRLEVLLDRAGTPWNTAFGGGAVVVPDRGDLPAVRFAGLTFTLLAPDRRALARLDAAWPDVLADLLPPLEGRRMTDEDAATPLADLASAPYTPDTTAANGSSIAFIAEHEDGGRILFAADSPAEALLNGLRRLGEGTPVALDVCKVPHHGSARNVSTDLVSHLACDHWLFSTSGARHAHPDRRAIARIVAGRPRSTLVFNYSSRTTSPYGDDAESARFGFRTLLPRGDRPGVTLRVSAGRVETTGPVRSGGATS